ncbi:DNA topology modulation protein [Lederbergia sp. NSJ-179]|uniref:DNA topology modulation protein n=1 Tax=Lederbergia sp. NSJ-179 TaxID=2931402 RepID=UPI001FD31D61|nr:DNA topology modulation protein [Lederbergia sp. NSJ-179]MCJ7841756.1 DNA topology modulation protein [Lederbergia sp. NSJ-179]
MQKIAIIGSGGSGKSTFARRLGELLQIEVYHLDALFWKPGWVGVSKQEQRLVQNELVEKEKWIIDGNYGGTMDIRLNKADTIIFLDIPRIICAYRVIKRWIQYRNTTRPDMGEGCEERISIEFLKWVWEYPKTKKPKILKKLDLLSKGREVIILKSSKEVEQFLSKINDSQLLFAEKSK